MDEPDRRALRIGWTVIALVLIGFVFGPLWHVEPWMVTFAATLFLGARLRRAPWRSVPILTAAGVAACTALVATVVPMDLLSTALHRDTPAALGAVVLAGTVAANLVDNLPALFIALDATPTMTAGQWAWLAGVNVGAVLLPWGALANLLWWRILRTEDTAITVRRYVRIVVPVALPATFAAALMVAGTSALWP